MSPLICFYRDELFIYANEYECMTCPEDLSASDFIKEVEEKFFTQTKVLQINFEYSFENLFTHQKKLYPSAKASVFILYKFKLLTLTEILNQLDTREIVNDIAFETLATKSEFTEKISFILENIKQGRIYQANITSALQASCTNNAIDCFAKYNSQFSGKYKALLPFPQYELLSFSPELFLHQENSRLITRPIKGSASPTDPFLNALLKNKKEEAELSMIVDLLRNDLNSLSNENAAVVNAHRAPLNLNYIQHTFSEIEVKSLHPLSYVLDRTMPGGSISGCPKIESLSVIADVEKYKRQAYTGALGWWKENDFCLNLTIRSFIKTQDHLFYHAGCGIVFESNPEAEWNEFLLKTGSLNVK